MKNTGIQTYLNQFQTELDCPVDGVKINENKVRTIAFFVLLTGIAYIVTSYWLLPLFLTVDFALRAFDYGKFSPLAQLSDAVVKGLNFPVRPIDQAPKRFAAGVGMVFTTAMLILHAIGINTLILTSVLLIFAALELLAGICAGCYVYTILKRSKLIR
ncbi:DUF4395 domain-containing protein [Spirosoma agri]|uniref:DUF4395 domain-containing protein n=1 Tax=Spirosoma agri TaxID=1987381 RepID=A0A6M0ILQ2_9BACT|nr:DUF4395 domain-containing protein [Spirosoma agri]NEU69198.1 DUF4395 domain-containing protein [Spirosoma agri]